MKQQAKTTPMNNYCVYKHISPSGKTYIGITCQDPSKRWKNGKGYEFCTAFNRAIKKYGWENISHEILLTGLDKQTACKEEQRLICKYRSNEPEHGYNLTSGGEHYEPNKEWRERLSKANKKYYQNNPSARIAISERQRGRKHSETSNKKRSETMKKYFIEHPEQREQRGRSFRGKKRGAEFSRKLGERKSKKVYCKEMKMTFPSVAKAAEALSISRTGISNMMHGRAKTCGGYTFTEGENNEGN